MISHKNMWRNYYNQNYVLFFVVFPKSFFYFILFWILFHELDFKMFFQRKKPVWMISKVRISISIRLFVCFFPMFSFFFSVRSFWSRSLEFILLINHQHPNYFVTFFIEHLSWFYILYHFYLLWNMTVHWINHWTSNNMGSVQLGW